MKVRCCAPGTMARAIKPTMKPTMMDQMMCNIVLFLIKLSKTDSDLSNDKGFTGVTVREDIGPWPYGVSTDANDCGASRNRLR